MQTIRLSRDILNREIVVSRALSRVIGVFAFVICTALGAYVRIPLPFTPVPITLQTFFVLLSGAVLGRKWGPTSQAGYLVLGALGLPIFSAAGSGIATFWGPTGGYLIGFVLASWIVARLIQRENQSNITRIVLAMVVGSLVGIYLCGVWGLILFLQCNLSQGLTLGFLPFIPGDTLKIIAAALIYRKIATRCNELF